MQKDVDILVYGATGFTGKLVAEYLRERASNSNVTWAIGGRSQTKLEDVHRSLNLGERVQCLVADSSDAAALDAAISRARVVLTTVGPYARYGSEVVAACVRHGTHYCDLTGEVHWMQAMIEAHQRQAEVTGARIVHTCGFDSIPSDLGVWFVQQAMRERHGVAARHVKYRAGATRGGFSGGTVDSMMSMMELAERDPDLLKRIADPYALNPAGERKGLDGPDRTSPEYDADFDSWVGPFVMAAINTRVVRRSNALLGYPYGRDFRYDEAQMASKGPLGFAAAAGIGLGLGAFTGLAANRITRPWLQKMMPKPGEGPSRTTIEQGYFNIDLIGKHPSDANKDVRVHIKGKRDPGYGATARMLTESALCLAQDELEVGGGFWTPASAMAQPLLERLTQYADIEFTVR